MYRAADNDTADRKVIKGGSYLFHESYCESYRPAARRGVARDTGSSHVGFRLASSENKSAIPAVAPR